MGQKLPSAEWTMAERISVVSALARQLNELAEKGPVDTFTLVYLSDKILFVLNADAGFLELNKKTILEGLSFSPSKIEAE